MAGVLVSLLKIQMSHLPQEKEESRKATFQGIGTGVVKGPPHYPKEYWDLREVLSEKGLDELPLTN